MFPCFREKPAFPTRDAPIDKRKLLLLSGRAMFGYRHKSLQEKQVSTDRTNKFSKAELYKSNFLKKISQCNYLLKFKKLSIFSCQFFCNSSLFSLLHFLFPIADIIVNHLYTLFLHSRKTNRKKIREKNAKKIRDQKYCCI